MFAQVTGRLTAAVALATFLKCFAAELRDGTAAADPLEGHRSSLRAFAGFPS